MWPRPKIAQKNLDFFLKNYFEKLFRELQPLPPSQACLVQHPKTNMLSNVKSLFKFSDDCERVITRFSSESSSKKKKLIDTAFITEKGIGENQKLEIETGVTSRILEASSSKGEIPQRLSVVNGKVCVKYDIAKGGFIDIYVIHDNCQIVTDSELRSMTTRIRKKVVSSNPSSKDVKKLMFIDETITQLNLNDLFHAKTKGVPELHLVDGYFDDSFTKKEDLPHNWKISDIRTDPTYKYGLTSMGLEDALANTKLEENCCVSLCMVYGFPILLLIATKNIRAGECLLRDSGEDYWETHSTTLSVWNYIKKAEENANLKRKRSVSFVDEEKPSGHFSPTVDLCWTTETHNTVYPEQVPGFELQSGVHNNIQNLNSHIAVLQKSLSEWKKYGESLKEFYDKQSDEQSNIIRHLTCQVNTLNNKNETSLRTGKSLDYVPYLCDEFFYSRGYSVRDFKLYSVCIKSKKHINISNLRKSMVEIYRGLPIFVYANFNENKGKDYTTVWAGMKSDVSPQVSSNILESLHTFILSN